MEKNHAAMLKKIAVTGPECSGKTTLCTELAEHYQCLWVPEMARIVLERDGPDYDAGKVESMARMQLEKEQEMELLARKEGHNLLFCDTDLLVYQIWMDQKFGCCPGWIREMVSSSDYSLTLLLQPDLPWQNDPLRENPHNRIFLFGLYETELKQNNKVWNTIKGKSRLQMAISLISEIYA
jgi:nicotinamide riboside kinase